VRKAVSANHNYLEIFSRSNASGKRPRANWFPIETAAWSLGSFQSDC
jgi:hypothetical protein